MAEVHFDATDVGKEIRDRDGEVIGTVTDVDESANELVVDPDETLSATTRSELGWDEAQTATATTYDEYEEEEGADVTAEDERGGSTDVDDGRYTIDDDYVTGVTEDEIIVSL